MSLMALVIAPPELEKEKCIKIAIVHDLAECITGDITPYDGITPEEKHKLEGIRDVTCIFDNRN